MKNIVFLLFISFITFLQSCRKDDDSTLSTGETILYQTDFSQNDGRWWTGGDNGITCSIQNGYYVFKNTNTSGINFTTLDPVFSGINTGTAIESSIKVVGTTGADIGSGGLLWNRNQQNNSDFEFMVNSIGKFRVFGYPDGSNFTIYKDWTVHSAVKANAFNTLRIEFRNNRLHFIINGTEVFSMNPVNDATLDGCGIVTLNQSVLQVDNFKAVKF